MYMHVQSGQSDLQFLLSTILLNDELVPLKLNEASNVSTNLTFSLCAPPLYYPKIRLLQSLSPSFHPSCPSLFKVNKHK